MRKLLLLTLIALTGICSICLAQPDTAYFWAGGYFDEQYQWHDTVYAGANWWIDIPIYFMGGPDVWIQNLCFPLGARYDLIDSFDISGCSWNFSPFIDDNFGWGIKEFGNYNDDQDHGHPQGPNPAGYHSLSFIGFAYFIDAPLLHAEVPRQILSFRVHTCNNDQLPGNTFGDALIEGRDPLQGPISCGDTLGAGYPALPYFSKLHFAIGFVHGTVIDYSGSPVHNVDVAIINSSFSTSTDLDGNYYMTSVPGGIYDLSFVHPSFCDTVVRNQSIIEGDTLTLDVELNSSILTGIVTDYAITPLDGVITTITGTEFIDTTDIFGRYYFRGICPGEYDLEFDYPGYCEMMISDVDVGVNDTVQVDAFMSNNGSITGVVYNIHGEPITGGIVSVIDMVYEDTSGIDGEYAINGLCPNTYDLLVTLPGYCDSTITGINISAGETVILDIVFNNGGVITGTITDQNQSPLSGAVVSVMATIGTDTSDINGEYSIIGLCPGTYDIEFTHEEYWQIFQEDVYVTHNFPTNLDIIMCPDPSAPYDTAIFWAGGHFDNCAWYDTISVQPGDWIDIPIYFMGGSNVWIANICYPLGARYDIFDQFDSTNCSSDYWPYMSGVHGWALRKFTNYNDDIDHGHPAGPNPQGYHSLSFIAYRWPEWPEGAYLHSDIPIKLLTFRMHVSDSLEANNQVIEDALINGVDCIQGHVIVGDTLGGPGYFVNTSYSCIKVVSGYKEYLPGDANMYNGAWPPAVIGGDVTYLVNYFRSMPSSQPCLLDGFWCSADANGDCNVIGSDVTRLVSYFRSMAELAYCPDYPPAWPTPADLPVEPPSGWPNCE